jgi:hypothetical protein
MSKHFKNIIAPMASVVALGGLVFALSGMNTFAQVTPENFGLADWVFTPVQGGTAPLFRSTDPVTVKLTNLKTNDVVVPADGQFTCRIEARAFQPASSSAAWSTIAAAATPYTVADGCSGSFTKAIRGNGLNWSLRATFTSVADNTKVYTFYNTYAFRFQGAGVASGG